MQHHDIAWDLPAPFTIDITVRAENTDRLGHANNVVCVRRRNLPRFLAPLLLLEARGCRFPEFFCALLQLVLFKANAV